MDFLNVTAIMPAISGHLLPTQLNWFVPVEADDDDSSM
jgi:hypothetical protein